ncbi:FkbM family methyltransferase [Zavarzinia sp. CC-PAN008]|uniref:FkbM family methyltransferase n=1 Tax=Zavarzinia sp. CC-PAN008 TaxID=3243332 RepID=UPI003F74245F
MGFPALKPRQRLTFVAHAVKAAARQHHRDLYPLVRRLVPADGIVVDVGAHAGQYTKLFARAAARGQVLAFEPGSYARRILEGAVAWNNLRNVEILPLALGEGDGSAVLSVPVKARGSLGFGLSHIGPSDRPSISEEVATTSLDALWAARRLARLDLIKIDVEGYELSVLRGAQGVMRRFHPALIVELVDSHLARAGSTPAQVFELMTGLGYAALRMDAPDVDRSSTALLSRFAGDGDYLFRVPSPARRT